MANVQALQRQGWYLTTEGIEECTENGKNSVDDIISVAKDLDLKDIGEKHLPDGISRNKVESVEGPFVLQVQKIRNVSAPKDNEESQSAPRLLRVTLTDGHLTCTGLQMEPIPDLSLNTPPGTKLKLLGHVPLNHGFLLLDRNNCKMLGGHVDKLVEHWELKRSLAKHSRSSNTSEGGPPPFIPFGQRRKDEQHSFVPKKDNFKSLDSSKEKKEDSEFEQQRQAAIAKLQETKEEGKKTFGSAGVNKAQQDKDVARIVDMGFTVDQANSALRQTGGKVELAVDNLLRDASRYSDSAPRSHMREDRDSHWEPRGGGDRGGGGGVRGGRTGPDRGRGRRGRGMADDEDGEDVHGRPSAPATLFDFVTKKIPSSSAASSLAKTDTHELRDDKKEALQGGTGANQLVRQSSAEDPTKRGPPNLPPRLIKQQQQREQERAERAYRQTGTRPPPTQRAQPQPSAVAMDTKMDTRSQSGPRSQSGSSGSRGSNPRLDDQEYPVASRTVSGPRGQGRAGPPGSGPGPGPRDRDQGRKYESNQRGPASRQQWASGPPERGEPRPRDYYGGQQGGRPPRGGPDNMGRYSGGPRSQDQYPGGRRGPQGGSRDYSGDYRDYRDYNRDMDYRGGGGSYQRDYTSRGGDYQRGGDYSGSYQTRNQQNEQRYQGSNNSTSSTGGSGSRREQSYQQSRPHQHHGSASSHSTQYTETPPSQDTTESEQSGATEEDYSQYEGSVDEMPAVAVTTQVNGDCLTSSGSAEPAVSVVQPSYIQTVSTPSQLNQQMACLQISSASSSLQTVPVYVEAGSEGIAMATQYLPQHPAAFLSAPPASVNSSCVPTMEFTGSNNSAANSVRHKQGNSKQQSDNNRANVRQWKQGDYCMAKYWEDQQFYRAIVHSMNPGNQSCFVTFPDYGNMEEVLFTDIRPVPKQAWETNNIQGPLGVSTAGVPVISSQGLTPAPGYIVQGPPSVPFMAAFSPTDQGASVYQPPIDYSQGTAVVYQQIPAYQVLEGPVADHQQIYVSSASMATTSASTATTSATGGTDDDIK